MELTGKCKESFEDWLVDVHYKGRHDASFHWVSCTESMRYGVYVDFFDSVGLEIIIDKYKGIYIYI